MNAVAIIQARMGSSRLPGKVLRPLAGRPMLAHIVERVAQAQGVSKVVVATSDQPADQQIVRFCADNDIACFAGNELDVLDRFYRVALAFGGDPVLRITADCPLVDPAVITELITLFHAGDYDHVGVATGAGALFADGGRYPDGLDTECMRFAVLQRAWLEATAATDREHVTPYLWRQPELFKLALLKSPVDYSSLRLTVDNEQDFDVINQIYCALYTSQRPFLLPEVLAFLDQHPQIAAANRHFVGQEGYAELWQPQSLPLMEQTL
jgi:spore coat polysaccharide biosynthesis protein SpsF